MIHIPARRWRWLIRRCRRDEIELRRVRRWWRRWSQREQLRLVVRREEIEAELKSQLKRHGIGTVICREVDKPTIIEVLKSIPVEAP